jgi:branched-chain amino acid aminotransferase
LQYINLNGKMIAATQAALPADNSAFRYGYGLFETMLVQNGSIRLWPWHWERLAAGLKQLYLHASFPGIDKMEAEILRAAKKNTIDKLCRVRLQVFAVGGGLYHADGQQLNFIIECFPIDPSAIVLNENGLVTGLAKGLMKSADTLSNLKSCNALIYAMAARQAKENKWNDALVCNADGHIIESAIANIFWISKGTVFTPPLTDGCVAGVMRRRILDKIEVTEKALSCDELLAADEVFLSNAVKGIKWVGDFEGAAYKASQVHSIYQSVFNDL